MDENYSDSMSSKQLSGKKKKKLFSKINTQMEFYFSDSNLAKDKYLQNLIDQNSEGYVDLEVFKSFNKLKALTEDVAVMVAAVSKSNILEVNEDKTKIRRVTPLGKPKDFDACTLYVEKLPSNVDHKWIKDVFEHFGVVDHINIPRFKISKKVKGFAFIEFSNPESVLKACEHYKNSSAKHCVKSEEESSKKAKTRKATQMSDNEEKISKKRKSDDVADSPTNKNGNDVETKPVTKYTVESSDAEKEILSQSVDKKRKYESNESDQPPKKLKDSEHDLLTSDDDKAQFAQREVENQSADDVINNSADETERKSRHKRKHKKRKAEYSERPSLRVMSKYEWKAYRNRYLTLQRSTMSHLKKQIMLETQELREHDLSGKSETVTEPQKKGLQFQSGVILKIVLSDPIENSTEVKDQVKANAAVAYIDAPLGHSEMFVRCHNQEEAQTILQDKKLHNLGSVQLLQDSEEQSYWQKIEDDRKIKFSVPLTHKKRGRDKIIAKAAKLAEQKNKHIYFEE